MPSHRRTLARLGGVHEQVEDPELPDHTVDGVALAESRTAWCHRGLADRDRIANGLRRSTVDELANLRAEATDRNDAPPPGSPTRRGTARGSAVRPLGPHAVVRGLFAGRVKRRGFTPSTVGRWARAHRVQLRSSAVIGSTSRDEPTAERRWRRTDSAAGRERARRRWSRAREDLDDSTDGPVAVGPEHRVI